MPVLIRGIFSGGGYKKSLILADNVKDLNIIADLNSMKLLWNIPDSEIEIKQFNIYIKKADEAPTDLSQFEKVATVGATETEYTITGLESGVKYYVVIESVSVEEYENASLRGMKNVTSQKGYWLLGVAGNEGGYQYEIYYSDDGESWHNLIDSNGETVTSYGGWGNIIAAEKRVFYGEQLNYNLMELDLQTKKSSYVYSLPSEYRYTSPKLYDAGRFIITGSLKSTGSSVMWYCNGVPEKGTNWISIGTSYGPMIGDHKGTLFTSDYIEGWEVYDFNSSPKWTEYGYSGVRDCNSNAYGNGKYVLVGEYNMSAYVLEENIRKYNSPVLITGVNSDKPAWTKVIYVEQIGKFFAVDQEGDTFYSVDLESWIPMNGGLPGGNIQHFYVNLVYGNGRLILTDDEASFSFYCVDGMNWIAMSGHINNPTGSSTKLISLYN